MAAEFVAMSLADIDIAATQAIFSADKMEGHATRVIHRTDGALKDFVDSIAVLLAALGHTRSLFTTESKRLAQLRSQWMDKHAEEIDANEKSLLACARLCDWNGCELEAVWSDVSDVLGVLDSSVMFARRSLMVGLSPDGLSSVSVVLSACTRVQRGVWGSQCVLEGPGVRWCKAGVSDEAMAQNVFSLVCRDEFGESVRGLERSDFDVSVRVGDVVGSVVSCEVDGDVLKVVFTVPDGGKAVSVQITDSCLENLAEFTSPVGASIQGVEVKVYSLQEIVPEGGISNCWGIAVRSDEAVMVVSGLGSGTLAIVSLPSGSLLRLLGGGTDPEPFAQPMKMCFAVNGNLLVVENRANRVQEVTLEGGHVRYIGDGILDDPYCVAANADVIVVGMSPLEPCLQLHLFNFGTGVLLRSICDEGSDFGQLKLPYDISFSPDCQSMFIAESLFNKRVSIFSVEGEFIRCFGDGERINTRAVVPATNGEIIVSSSNRRGIFVYSPDGSSLLRTFGTSLSDVHSLAVVGARLYALDRGSAKVHVFE